MNPDHLQLAKKKCEELLEFDVIVPSDSQWACEAFYVTKELSRQEENSECKKILQTDASNKYWSVILFEEKDGRRKICGYASGKFKDAEQHYHSTFKGILTVKNGIKKFNFFLIHTEVLIEMDMKAFPKMIQINAKIIPNPQILRWAQWFSPYKFQVKHLKGKDNILTDFQSRP
ncbi:PREDICTED: uncharacterized protein LOC109242371 [Nicotiana attenuata]|uniref:uncharacterized protein LOC109242371 n=1 Tax=Nicotiana attenuata TaxID=49451 RepID=UPI000904F579|nr:PREDICTED: uncharacterized protein LOC109242371 [Nicotiana attenuata]